MTETLLKHSRMPRKVDGEVRPVKARKSLVNTRLSALREADPLKILERYLSDESTETIAKSYGVTRQSLGQFLLRNAEEDWKEAQVARAIARKEQAEDEINSAADALELAKAREKLKSAQWDLERVCRRIYGQDHNINFNLNITDLGDRLRRARERVIEAKAVEVLPAAETV